MLVELVEVKNEEKKTLANLLELHEHELSNFTQLDVNEEGRYGYRYFDCYWEEENRYPFFIRADNKIAGFVLVCDYCYQTKAPDQRMMAEFFILKKYRRMGIGKRAAFLVFDKIHGHWEIGQLKEHREAKIFWEMVIKEYTRNQYEKIDHIKKEGFEGQLILFSN